MSQIRLAVIVPAYGGNITAEHARMWVEFGNVVGASSETFRLTTFGHLDMQPIDRARNMAVAQAMVRDSTWLLMVDADTWVEPGKDSLEDAGVQLLRMIADANRRGAVIVSAPVIKRIEGHEDRVLAVYGKPAEDNKHVGFPDSWIAEQRRSLVPVHAVGAACCAINLEKLANTEIEYGWTDRLSEDLEFCRRIREHFGDSSIMVDPRVRTAHRSKPTALYSSP